MGRLQFSLLKEATGSRARASIFNTLHGEVRTPIFMPVGTHATVRGQRLQDLKGLGFPILLANTYHLLLRPGPEVFQKMGGIQKFMGWKHSVLTDSGGFQIFSLPNERHMTEEGAIFRSYTDQRKVLLTPEKSIEMQKHIGSDIMMVLDQCISSTAEMKEAKAAMELTHRWALRSLEARGESPQSIFAIVQGACFKSLRKESANFLTQHPFDGFAIGGLAVGETKSEREDMTEYATEFLPKDLPRYLMGVGTPIDLLEAVHRGVDMFDCILPTALGQQGVAYTSKGKIDLRRGIYRLKEERLDPECVCTACNEHSIAYLHHLIRVKESTGSHLVAAHNLVFYAKLMSEIRASILDDTFFSYYQEKREILGKGDGAKTHPTKKKNRRPALELGKYKVHEVRPGSHSIQHVPSGEVMHSVNDPTEEAHRLYIEQSKLVEKLQEHEEKPLVIWDVGLGAAINAMAVLSTYEKSGSQRPVHLVSFENDLDSLTLSLKHKNIFAHLRHAAPETVLAKKEWTSKNQTFRWTLLEGDFLEKMFEASVPDLIFFDPFSYKTDTEAWKASSFHKIFSICKNHATELFTYSSSTAVRALLLAAGFFVAKGAGTGPKSDTTIALTPKAASETPYPLLSSDWLSQWERSGVKFPPSIHGDHHAHFENTIRTHSQFIG